MLRFSDGTMPRPLGGRGCAAAMGGSVRAGAAAGATRATAGAAEEFFAVGAGAAKVVAAVAEIRARGTSDAREGAGRGGRK
jgi:hypothetical protein